MMNGNKKIFFSILLVLCIALAIAVAFFVGDKIVDQKNSALGADDEATSGIAGAIYIDDELYLPRLEVRNYLIMGIDKSAEAEGNAVGQVDFLLILSFNSNTKEYTMIPINRDTMVEVNKLDILGNEKVLYEQIALSHHVVGSEGLTNKEKCANTINAASKIFHGMQFDGYMSMTMDAVDILVDRFGGVDVYVEEDYTSVDPRLVGGTTVTMDGELAMKFVRMRGGLEDSSNVARMKRQEAFLKAFFSKMGEAQSSDEDIIATYSEIEKYVYNSSGMNGYEEIFWKLKNYEEGESVTLRGEAKVGRGGFMEFYIDDSHVEEVIANVFYKKAGQ